MASRFFNAFLFVTFLLFIVANSACAEPIHLALIGDSLTCAYRHYVVESAASLNVDAYFTLHADYGVTSSQLIGDEPFEGELHDFVADAIDSSPDAVFFMIGTNDNRNDEGAETFETYKSNIIETLDRLTSMEHHPQIILGTLIPILTERYEAANERLDTWYNPWLRDIADEYSGSNVTLIDFNARIQAIENWQDFYGDGVHLYANDSAGFKWMAQTWVETLTAMPPVTGDVNYDRVVDDADLSIIFENWLREGPAQTDGDINGDGRIDGSDVTILAGSWQKSGGPDQGDGDINQDGKVDGSDVTILAGSWQQSNTGINGGDLNQDGIVDGGDVTILASNWQASITTLSDGDLNGDGAVDGSDVTILAGNWQATTPSKTEGDLNGDGRVDGEDILIVMSNWHYNVPSELAGDINNDGYVDGSDVTILAGNWQQGHAGWSEGDLNGDGYVDGSDVTILAGNWQQSLDATTTASVPEPSTTAILLTLLFSMAARLFWQRKKKH